MEPLVETRIRTMIVGAIAAIRARAPGGLCCCSPGDTAKTPRYHCTGRADLGAAPCNALVRIHFFTSTQRMYIFMHV